MHFISLKKRNFDWLLIMSSFCISFCNSLQQQGGVTETGGDNKAASVLVMVEVGFPSWASGLRRL